MLVISTNSTVAIATVGGSYYTDSDLTAIHYPGGIPVQPKELEHWLCYSNDTTGGSCPPRLISNTPGCKCNSPNAAYQETWEYVIPVEEVVYLDVMNKKDDNNKWITTGTIMHKWNWIKCYDNNNNLVGQCLDLGSVVDVNVYACFPCPTGH
ncbi:MAG: hypothetical protein R3F46_01805 [bacterium]